jgi:hypothetical protein
MTLRIVRTLLSEDRAGTGQIWVTREQVLKH